MVNEKNNYRSPKLDNDSKEDKVSIDVYYQEKYKEMRRHRDYELSTANWCTIILLAIIAGFVSLKSNGTQITTLYGSCGILLFKVLVVLFITAVVFSGAKIIDYSSKRYKHMRDWVSENIEPTINGKKYQPEAVAIRIKDVIIAILVILGLLASGIVIIL